MLDLVGLLADNSSCRMPQKRNTKNKKLKRKDLRDLDVKITFLEGIVRRDPQFVDALKVLVAAVLVTSSAMSLIKTFVTLLKEFFLWPMLVQAQMVLNSSSL